MRLYLVFVLILFGCSKPLEIEQQVKLDSCVEQTFTVKTILWCHACDSRTIELLLYANDLKASQVDSVKKVQMGRALIAYKRAEEALAALGKLKAGE